MSKVTITPETPNARAYGRWSFGTDQGPDIVDPIGFDTNGVLYFAAPNATSADTTVQRGASGGLTITGPAGTTSLGTPNVRVPEDHNLASWAYDPTSNQTSSAPSAGTLHLIRLPLRVPKTISNIWLGVSAFGTALTAGQNFAALYTEAGVLLSATADQSVNWATGSSAGVTQQIPLSVAQANLPAGYYYVAILVNGAGLPSFIKGGSISASLFNIGLAAAHAAFATNGAALTSMPASFTPGSSANEANSWFAALS